MTIMIFLLVALYLMSKSQSYCEQIFSTAEDRKYMDKDYQVVSIEIISCTNTVIQLCHALLMCNYFQDKNFLLDMVNPPSEQNCIKWLSKGASGPSAFKSPITYRGLSYILYETVC